MPQLPGTADFSLTADPARLTIVTGSSGEFRITVSSVDGFSGTVTISVPPSPLCPSPYCTVWSFYPSIVTLDAGGTATATLTVVAGTPGTGNLTVTAASGSLSHSVTVVFTIVSPSVVAAFTYNPCVMCAAPGSVVFFDASWSTAQAGRIVSYDWDFGDGSPIFNTNRSQVTHMYGGEPSKWNVALTVTTQDGTTDTVRQLVMFFVAPSFGYQPPDPFVGEKVVFNASSSRAYGPKIEGTLWDFGDGSLGSGTLAGHSYALPGAYRVSMTLVTTSGNPSVSETVFVWKSPDVDGDGSVSLDDLIGVYTHQFTDDLRFDLDDDGSASLDDLLYVHRNQFKTV